MHETKQTVITTAACGRSNKPKHHQWKAKQLQGCINVKTETITIMIVNKHCWKHFNYG